MKKIIAIGIFNLIFCISLPAQVKFVINGSLKDIPEKSTVLITYQLKNEQKVDSVVSRQGKFTLTGWIDNATKAEILVKPLIPNVPFTMERFEQRDAQYLFLGNGITSVIGKNMKQALITGGPDQADYLELRSKTDPLNAKIKSLINSVRKIPAHNKDSRKELFREMNETRRLLNQSEEAFIKSHRDSFVSLELLDERSGMINLATFEPMFDQMSDRIKQSFPGKLIADKLLLAKRNEVGNHAYNFIQNNTQGEPVKLSSFEGKYVLIDFWASWCGPCRAQHPALLKIYQEFKGRNFEIISVSLDSNKESWLKAIHEDTLPWIQVSDLKGSDNEIALAYGISSIPQNYLIGPTGIILEKNLMGDELIQKLRASLK